MHDRVERFVEWADGPECYVMVEVEYAAADRPRRRLSAPLKGAELTARLLASGMSGDAIEQLLADARHRWYAHREARSATARLT